MALVLPEQPSAWLIGPRWYQGGRQSDTKSNRGSELVEESWFLVSRKLLYQKWALLPSLFMTKPLSAAQLFERLDIGPYPQERIIGSGS